MNVFTPPAVESSISNVVPIDEASAKELEIIKHQRAREFCVALCRRVMVDSKLRTLSCRDCGKVIDPFSYVEQWANDGQRRMTGLQGLEEKTKVARGELERLARQIENVRAQLKRAGFPQPQADRNAYKSDLLNADNPAYQIRAV